MEKETPITEEQLINNINVALAEYQSKVDTAARKELSELSGKVIAAKNRLSDFLSQGANACPYCEAHPMGMIRTITQAGNIYEVGCVMCPAVIIDGEGKIIDTSKVKPNHKDHSRVSVSAQGYTRELAVKNWNDKKYLRDKKF